MKSQEQNYEELQKALALKRHEQPPPRFFKSFSDEVLDRLHEPPPPRELTWKDRLGMGEDSRPFMLCLLGIVLCGALVMGLIIALKIDKPKPLERDIDPAKAMIPSAQGTANQSLPGLKPLTTDGNPPSLAPVTSEGLLQPVPVEPTAPTSGKPKP